MWRRRPHLHCNQRHGVLLLLLGSVIVAVGSILLPLWVVRLSGPFTGDSEQKKTVRDSAPRRGTSLERLVQAAAAIGDDDNDSCTGRKTLSRNITSSIVIDANDFDYVNCGLLGTPSHYPLDQIVPRSLLQCRDFQAIIDDGYLTIIPRDDLFPILHHGPLRDSSKPTTAIEQGLSLGSVHFHYHEYLNSTAATSATTTLVDAEWFLHGTFSNPIEAWYLNLSQYVSHVLNCTCNLPPMQVPGVVAAAAAAPTCQCPIFNHAAAATTSAARAATTVVVPVQDPTTNASLGVQFSHFFPDMYQMPRAKVASTRAMSSNSTTDPVTPSVAVFRQAYAEVGSGRVFVETLPQDDNCRPPRSHTAGDNRRGSVPKLRHRQYLIQFNQCYVQWDKNDFYRPFRGTIQIPKYQVHNLSVHRFDTAVLVTADFYDSFYHALVENLPRLLLVYDLVAADTNLTIVAAKSQDANEESLLYALAKVWNLESRMVFVDQHDDLMYANVLYIPEPTPCGQLQPLLAQATQRAIRQRLHSPNETLLNPFLGLSIHDGSSSSNSPPLPRPLQPLFELADKWILVIRRRTGSRRWIDNHNEMMTSLRATFPNEQWHVLDEMANDNDNSSSLNSGSNDRSYPTIGIEQWTVFARAKLVIAPHGGALANLLACDAGTHVVEYYGDGMDRNLCYLHLSVALNLHHHPLRMQRPTQNVQDGDGATTAQAGKYAINVPHLLRVVHNILLYIGTSVT